MAKCGNCESHVHPDSVRVLYPTDVDPQDLPCCPRCAVMKGDEWHFKENGPDDTNAKPSNANTPDDFPDEKNFSPAGGQQP